MVSPLHEDNQSGSAPGAPDLTKIEVAPTDDVALCVTIRKRVFEALSDELRKGATSEQEKDGWLPLTDADARDADTARTTHLLATVDGIPAGTLRLFVQKTAMENRLGSVAAGQDVSAEELTQLSKETSKNQGSGGGEEGRAERTSAGPCYFYGRCSQVAVSPEFQRLKIGTLLMTAAEAFLTQAYGVRLMKMHGAGPALPFYETLGYKPIGDLYRAKENSPLWLRDIYREW